jgi:putative oxidoreductase
MFLFNTPSTRQLDIGLTLLRIVVGTVFVAHGGQKLFVWGLDGVAAGFAEMGIPLAGVAGPMVGLLEFFGGIALIAGLLTRPVAVGLAVTMSGAIVFAHLPAGFFLPNGYEFALTLLGASAFIAIAGAGSYSLDRLIARRFGARMADPGELSRAESRRAA